MNTYAHKPMPFGAKLRALYDGRYMLSSEAGQDLVWLVQNDWPESKAERLCIEYIDKHGEWLD